MRWCQCPLFGHACSDSRIPGYIYLAPNSTCRRQAERVSQRHLGERCSVAVGRYQGLRVTLADYSEEKIGSKLSGQIYTGCLDCNQRVCYGNDKEDETL